MTAFISTKAVLPLSYAPIGERCRGEHDRQAGGRINAVGALQGNELLTVGPVDGGINSDVFYAWVKQELLPRLTERCAIIMDNAAFRKRRDIQEAVRSNGHLLEYLPVYSPDLNPIEHEWDQAKALGRRHRCSVEELFRDHKL